MVITEDSLLRIIEDTWNSTLGFQVDCQSKPEPLSKDALTVSTRITGQWSGEVQLDCSLPLARLIAGATFQVQAESATHDQIVDALSELVHIVGGNLKTLLPQPVQLSLPRVSDKNPDADTSLTRRLISKLVLMSCAYPFVVTLRADPSNAE